jgi:hypothetical protein
LEYCCSLSLLLWLLGVTVPVPFDPRAGVEAISLLLQAQSFPTSSLTVLSPSWMSLLIPVLLVVYFLHGKELIYFFIACLPIHFAPFPLD